MRSRLDLRARLRAAVAVARDFSARAEEHSLFSHAAALGFYLFFSLPPAALALVALIGWIPLDRVVGAGAGEMLDLVVRGLSSLFPERVAHDIAYLIDLHGRGLIHDLETLEPEDIHSAVQAFVERNLNEPAAKALGGISEDVLGHPSPGLFTLAFVSMLWAASAATRALLRALGVIYAGGRRHFILRNLLAYALTFGVLAGGTLAASFLFLVNALAALVLDTFDLSTWIRVLWSIISWSLALTGLLGALLLLHRFGARAVRKVRNALFGSLLTVALWVLLALALRFWTAWSWETYNATYGTLAGVIVLLFLCYLASLALLVGAEINAMRHAARAAAESSAPMG